MHSRAHGHLGRFQIEAACFAPLLENDTQELVYFLRDFPADLFGRFFSSGVRVSSTGRKRQICSLTSTSSWPSCWKRRNSAISCSALRTAAGVGKASVTVVPCTL